MNIRDSRQILVWLYRAALEGSDPQRAVARALRRPRVARILHETRRVGLFAVGKAAASMASGVPGAWQKETLVVLPASYPPPELPCAEVLFGNVSSADSISIR